MEHLRGGGVGKCGNSFVKRERESGLNQSALPGGRAGNPFERWEDSTPIRSSGAFLPQSGSPSDWGNSGGLALLCSRTGTRRGGFCAIVCAHWAGGMGAGRARPVHHGKRRGDRPGRDGFVVVY